MKPAPRSPNKFRKVRAGSHRAIYCPDARPISPRLPPLVSSGGVGSFKPAFAALGAGVLAFLTVAAAIVRAAVVR